MQTITFHVKLNSEVLTEAFTRNHLVISMDQSVGLEVRGTPRISA